MKLLEVKCSLRETVGKKDSKKLRRKGMVPCVLYGGEEIIHFYAHENDFRNLVYSPNIYIVKLEVEDKSFKAVLQDIQFHPVTDKILHMDFYQVYDDRPVTMDIPVHLDGVPEGVKQGGKLALETRRLKSRALPGDLPDILNVDATGIGLGKVVKVGDLEFPGIQLLDPENLVVASVKLTRASRGVLPEDEEDEGEAAEGEETTGEESEETQGGEE